MSMFVSESALPSYDEVCNEAAIAGAGHTPSPRLVHGYRGSISACLKQSYSELDGDPTNLRVEIVVSNNVPRYTQGIQHTDSMDRRLQVVFISDSFHFRWADIYYKSM